jgi:hypothetical protein
LPQLVLVEAGYFVRKLLGPVAEAGFLRELIRGSLDLQPLEHDDLIRMAELIETYADPRARHSRRQRDRDRRAARRTNDRNTRPAALHSRPA